MLVNKLNYVFLFECYMNTALADVAPSQCALNIVCYMTITFVNDIYKCDPYFSFLRTVYTIHTNPVRCHYF